MCSVALDRSPLSEDQQKKKNCKGLIEFFQKGGKFLLADRKMRDYKTRSVDSWARQ